MELVPLESPEGKGGPLTPVEGYERVRKMFRKRS